MLFMGKEVGDWQDIYALMIFRGQQPKSLRDLMQWQAPITPAGCLKVAMDLVEARLVPLNNEAAKWIEHWLINKKDMTP